MTRIIKLTESDLSRIIDKVLNESTKKRKILSEQKLNSDGTYTIKDPHYFSLGLDIEGSDTRLSTAPPWEKKPIVKRGSDGKSVEFDLYGTYWSVKNQALSNPYIGKGKVICGENEVRLKDNGGYFPFEGLLWRHDEPTNRFRTKYGNAVILWGNNDITTAYERILELGGVKNFYYEENNPDTPFTKTMNKLFCDGRKLKSVQKPATKSKCKFVEKEFKNQEVCFLSGDTEWMYAKTDDGKWYTTRQTDKKTWCELTAPKFQKAINILVAGCKGLQPVPELKIKELEPIDTSTNDMVLKKTEQQKSEFENKMKNLPQ
jgi:hypothetical protein